MAPLKLNLKTVTPIWTGDADGKADQRVIATSILGGMRWWLEALARGVGAAVPDPTGDRQPYDANRKPDGGLDPVSLVFGATGWRRRFRLTVADSTSPAPLRGSIPIRTGTPRNANGISTWYFKSGARQGSFELQFLALERNFNLELLQGLLSFVTHWAGIGARNQMGLGIATLEKRGGTAVLLEWLRARQPVQVERTLPAIDSMFFAELQHKQGAPRQVSNREEDTFFLKADLRRLFSSAQERHEVMGWVKGNTRMGGRIAMSFPFGTPPRIRVWGWLPPSNEQAREASVRSVYNHIHALYELRYWREFGGSGRDSTGPTTDRLDFVQSMIEGAV